MPLEVVVSDGPNSDGGGKCHSTESNVFTSFALSFITVTDVADLNPQFINPPYEARIEENSPVGTSVFTVTAIDPDTGVNDKIIYTIEASTKVGLFAINEDSGLITVASSIDREDVGDTVRLTVKVIATDQEEPTYSSTATVTIDIRDANDNIPKFQKDTYKLQVPENSPIGTTVATITAEDPDTMDQDQLTYKLLPDSILPYFDVVPRTGAIYVKNQTLLDREVRSLYSVTLRARDTDDKVGSTAVEITVTDINDQAPVFNRDSYLVFVGEGGECRVKIEATDGDEPHTPNSQIMYGIVPSQHSGNFTINPNTGVLENSGVLDREAIDPKLNGRIELNVTATDGGTPRLSSQVPVLINVEDMNDNTPQFQPTLYEFSVKEGEIGAFVGSVFAEDLDQTTDFNRISFSIIDGSFGSFIIRTFPYEGGYRGNITVDPDIELDYESNRKEFRLRVEATDLEQKKAEVMVVVKVLDVNDERPEFKPTGPVTVKENTSFSEAIGSFRAQDRDGDHSLVYELESVKCMCNGSLTTCNWFILDPSGEVRLNPEETVDYEQCDQGVVEAQVVDEKTEKGENNSVRTGQLVINIEDINDNIPEFIPSDAVFVVVSESASKGTSVAGVTATDRDTGINRKIEFRVTKVQFQDNNNQTSNMRMLFEAVTTQQNDIYVGIIQTTVGLDMSLKGKYLVTVNATDTGGLFSSIVLDIFTVDESYKVELQFTQGVADVEQNRDKIIRSLMAATKAAVEVVAIRADTADESRATGVTVMVAYFVYSNGTALTSDDVEKMVSDPEHYPVLADLGLTYIGNAPVVEPTVDPLLYILLGMVGGLIIVLAVLTTSLLCTRRNYRRKLKAAKAMNSASMVTSDNQKSGPVVPGTNKYTMEGANPVLNLNIDTTMVMDLDEEDSDVDKVSLNSLDYSDEVPMSGKDTKPIMPGIQEEEENDDGPPEYIEPLGAALAQRGQKKQNL
ncbi:hypothetical protein INR49_024806 [Caranx melampygus]|nr:hypothetical protein INR49_024806 [Caranx melampygus]